jgi:hypothetical protein
MKNLTKNFLILKTKFNKNIIHFKTYVKIFN